MEGFSLAKIRNMLPSLTSPEVEDSSSETTGQPTSTDTSKEPELATDIDRDAPTTLEPRPLTPDDQKPRSNLDLINECDSFPYPYQDPTLYMKHINTYYALQITAHPNLTLGYILPSVAEVFRGLPAWSLDDEQRTLTLIHGSNEEERSAVVAATVNAMRQINHFVVLKGWRNELLPVYGPKQELLFSIERAASALFGIVTYGCHMTAYTYGPRTSSTSDDATAEREDTAQAESSTNELKIWVPRRALTKQTYGGMLDNTVAGGLATGESPFEGLVRESAEEASLPASLVRSRARAAGTVSYFYIRDARAGGETGLLQPEIQYVYDVELPADVQPTPSDDEVESFSLMGVDEVKERLRVREFKPNCALVMLDFFVRHGVLDERTEGDYARICARLHRVLEFPVR